MRERDTVWIHLADDRRPAVVLELQPDLVRVAYGTQHERPPPRAVVHPGSRQGRVFALHHVTYFVGANTAWEAHSALERGGGRVSYEVFFELRQLIEEHDANLVER